jgi:hypothetical protein
MQKKLWVSLLMIVSLYAQAQKTEDKNPSFKRELSLETKTEAKGEVTIKGQKVPYKVVSGTIPFGMRKERR